MTGWHVGRAWSGNAIEDSCPCPKEACGLVDLGKTSTGCDQHPVTRAKTMRQGHEASQCPGTITFDA